MMMGANMKIKRFFSTDAVKGTKNYLSSQRKYEVIRTILYFCISLSLFFAGLIATKTRTNLLTIVAILGCLPASKSLVETIMYFKYKSLDSSNVSMIEASEESLFCLYDLVLTTREKTFPVGHMVICDQTIIGFIESAKTSEHDCEEHIKKCLKTDHFTDITVKMFKDISKYTERMNQLASLQDNLEKNNKIGNTIKSISL